MKKKDNQSQRDKMTLRDMEAPKDGNSSVGKVEHHRTYYRYNIVPHVEAPPQSWIDFGRSMMDVTSLMARISLIMAIYMFVGPYDHIRFKYKEFKEKKPQSKL
jgi:hypothetical protein